RRHQPVLERGLAFELQLDDPLRAARGAHEHVLRLPVAGRAALAVRALPVVVPGSDGERVANHEPAGAGLPGGLEHHAAGEIAVRARVVDLPPPALRVEAHRVRAHAPVAREPALAVPDLLLDAHAARQGVVVARLVPGEEELDEPARLGAVARVVHVEVPIDRAALRMQALAAAELLAAHDPPRDAAGVLLEPALECERALLRVLQALL